MRKDRAQSTEHRRQNTDSRTQTGDYEKQRHSLGSGFSRLPVRDKWALGSEKGMVLIVSLLLLLVATVVGITALSTSTTNVMITGNQRLNEVNFRGADSGINLSIPIISTTVYDRAVGNQYAPLVTALDFVDEMSGGLPRDGDCPVSSACLPSAPDIQFTLGIGAAATTVSVDVDYLYSAAAAGAALPMFWGYEGAGTGMGKGGTLIYYPIDSYAEGPVGSQTRLYGVYLYVTK